LLKATYASSQPADQIELRLIIILAEQLLIAWFGVYGSDPRQHAFFENLGSWKAQRFEYFGMNMESSLRSDFKRPEKPMPVDQKTFHKRKVDLKKARQAEWTDVQAEKKRKDAIYNRIIGIPLRKIQGKEPGTNSKRLSSVLSRLSTRGWRKNMAQGFKQLLLLKRMSTKKMKRMISSLHESAPKLNRPSSPFLPFNCLFIYAFRLRHEKNRSKLEVCMLRFLVTFSQRLIRAILLKRACYPLVMIKLSSSC
jgi:hypothetical protein